MKQTQSVLGMWSALAAAAWLQVGLLGARAARRGRFSSNRSNEVYLYASDFEGGTYRITEPGKYMLYQDISFEPQGPEVTETLFPKADSTKYPQLEGYFLGFFAAIAVEADNVEIDCKGHEIKMSERFHKHQRFFSIIELGSKPFKAGQGPPQFSSYITSPGPVRAPNNVHIHDCTLGLSSHHGIHGHATKGLKLANLTIHDFEVGGVSLNGASEVELNHLDVGPSLGNTFTAQLSQAIFLDHLANSILPRHDGLRDYVSSAIVKLRGEQKTAKEVFNKLRLDLRELLRSGSGPLKEITGDGSLLPDGSAVYGVLLHRTGVAIGDFGACPSFETPDQHMVADIHIKDVQIHDLRLDAEQVTKTVADGKQFMGPAGDVFEITNVWDASHAFKYVGNPLSDAQIAMGALLDSVGSYQMLHPLTWADAKYYFGNVNIPAQVQSWAAGDLSDADTVAWADSLQVGGDNGKFQCDGDAMSHHNKGVVGMRLGFQEDVVIEDVSIKNLQNVGNHDAKFCQVSDYKGGDVRGLHLSHVKNMQETNLHIDDSSLHSAHGNVMTISTTGEVSLLQEDTRHASLGRVKRRWGQATSFDGMLSN
mmetsp:Transcript_111722/g.326705  ORF Transcript_111722/g.326705 Transcript_111722/m.326705 type:complete len:593 (-) Transcript_111722:106-1884(-)